MPRITLASWHAGHQPGEDIDVSEEEYRQLKRDGRVASVVDKPADAGAQQSAPAEPQPEPEPEPEPESAQDKPAAERSGRKRR